MNPFKRFIFAALLLICGISIAGFSQSGKSTIKKETTTTRMDSSSSTTLVKIYSSRIEEEEDEDEDFDIEIDEDEDFDIDIDEDDFDIDINIDEEDLEESINESVERALAPLEGMLKQLDFVGAMEPHPIDSSHTGNPVHSCH